MTSGTGTGVVHYNQAGNENYNPAPKVTENVTAQKAAQTINVTTHAPSSAQYSDGFTVAATGGGSGNPVVITSDGIICITTEGGTSTATIIMAIGTGTGHVYFNQAGNENYEAATQIIEDVLADQEDASIILGDNVVSVKVATPGGNSGTFSLAALIKESFNGS